MTCGAICQIKWMSVAVSHCAHRKEERCSASAMCDRIRMRVPFPTQYNALNSSFFCSRSCDHPFNHYHFLVIFLYPNLWQLIKVLVTCTQAHTFLVARWRHLFTFKTDQQMQCRNQKQQNSSLNLPPSPLSSFCQVQKHLWTLSIDRVGAQIDEENCRPLP